MEQTCVMQVNSSLLLLKQPSGPCPAAGVLGGGCKGVESCRLLGSWQKMSDLNLNFLCCEQESFLTKRISTEVQEKLIRWNKWKFEGFFTF